LIHERTGVFFVDSRLDILLDKLEPLAQNAHCDSFLQYYYLLKDNNPEAWNRIWTALSVLETHFWRETSQVEAFTSVILPAWFARRAMTFRIWCAAGATGEEPYSIAMALAEAGLGSHPIEIIGSDANPAALEAAKNAVYREKSFRSLPLHLRQKYFSPVANGSQLSANIVQRIKWQRANLSDSKDIAPLASAQAIFCRNVFIYFSHHAIRQTVAGFAARMSPGSHLFVGASESLLRLTTDFELKEVANAQAYVRI
jgi:chemotaxis protein methyltransferase CheR